MKRTIICGVILMILLAALTGCSGTKPPANEAAAPGGNAGTPAAAPAETPGSNVSIPTDAKVENAYLTAREAYNWFNFGTMPTDSSDWKDAGDYRFERVVHEQIETFADLEFYLNTIFTKKFTNEILSGDHLYSDIDGKLYAVAADRGSDILKGDERAEIIRESDRKIIYRITVDVLDEPEGSVVDTEVFDFVYAVEDGGGQWLFHNFESVR